MGIDRIGKGGAPAVPDPGTLDKAGKKGSIEGTFHVDRPAEASATEKVDATSPLARLRAGEIDVDRYVDLKVDEATRGLKGLPPTELAEIKKALRDQVATDPALGDLVRAATGSVVTEPED
jgi:hypothetical protein